MDADKNPDYLRQVAAVVRDFRDAFLSLMELHTPTYEGPGRGLVPPVSPREGANDAELQQRRTRVAETAGRARRAPGLTGVKYHVEGRNATVDPIAAWGTVLQPKPVLEPENIIDACKPNGRAARRFDRAGRSRGTAKGRRGRNARGGVGAILPIVERWALSTGVPRLLSARRISGPADKMCRVIGLVNVKDVRDRLAGGIDQTYPIADSLGRTQQATIVSEPGMYEIVIRSDKPPRHMSVSRHMHYFGICISLNICTTFVVTLNNSDLGRLASVHDKRR